MLKALCSSRLGCHIGDTVMLPVACADDVVIISTTVHSSSKLLEICHNISVKNDAKFNTSKTKEEYQC